ncbi:hypothetical protein ARSQ2_02131 [Arsenophonus endosymbiont of Bemisia tabaci Q2]|nr:hypothetical protein ARSQ2_02131 [Arsenophonus endosymbiont of Bemisia tabaci Q2]
MTQITVIKRSNYAQRRYERRAAFLEKKRQEAEQKCQIRSTEQILDSLFNKQDDTPLILSHQSLSIQKTKSLSLHLIIVAYRIRISIL